MEKLTTDFSIGLLLWQTFLVVLFAAIVYFLVKLYKKIMRNTINKN